MDKLESSHTVGGGVKRYSSLGKQCFVVVQSLSHIRLFVTAWTAARLPCPSVSSGVCSNSCPLSQWCHPTISSYAIPFSSHLQSFPASVSFPMSQFFTSGDQSIGVSALASVLPGNIQDWFPLELTGLISLKFEGLSRISSNTTVLCVVLCIYDCLGTYRFLSSPFTFLFNHQIHFVNKAVHVPDLKE